MGKLMDVMQNVVRGQEENRQTNQRVVAVVPIINPTIGNKVPVVTQIPLEGVPVNLNAANTFHVPVHGGSQADVDDHHDALFVLRVELMYEPYGQSPADIDRKFRMRDERSKAIEGPRTFGLDAADMYLVQEVRIPARFKVPGFEKYKGTFCPKTHIISFYRKVAAYSDDEKLLMHCFQDSLSGASLE